MVTLGLLITINTKETVDKATPQNWPTVVLTGLGQGNMPGLVPPLSDCLPPSLRGSLGSGIFKVLITAFVRILTVMVIGM